MAATKIQSSTYSPIYPTSLETGNLLVEMVGNSGTPEGLTPTPTIRTPGLLITSTAGTIAAGATSVAIANSGASDGTVLGYTIPSGVVVSWKASFSDTLAAISYNPTGTTFIITEVR